MSAPVDGLTILTDAAVAASRSLSGSRRSRAFAASRSACFETALRQRRIECSETNPFLDLPAIILATLVNENTRVNLSRVCQRLRRFVRDLPEVYETITLDPASSSRQSASPQHLTAVVQLTPHTPIRYLTIRLGDTMSDTWFEGVCHLVEATLSRVQDLTLELPGTFDSPVFTRALKGPAQRLASLSLKRAEPYLPPSDPDRPDIRGTAWDFERFFVDGARRLTHCVSDVDIFQAPSNKLSNLRTLVISSISRFNRAKDIDDLLAFLPNLEELSVRLCAVRRLRHLQEEPLAPCAFFTVHRKLRYLRVERLRGTACSLVTLCAVLGCVQIVAIEPVPDWLPHSGSWPCSDICNALPIISSISVGSALCEYVCRRTIKDKPIRVLRGMSGKFGGRNLRDVLDMPTLPHLTTLSFHEFFWTRGSDTPFPALPNLRRLRIMLASCREYGTTFDGTLDPARPSILQTWSTEWDLPALRTIHLSFFPNSLCYNTSKADCTCLRPTMSVALSDVCSFASAPMRWSGGQCEALRLSGVSIVDVDAEKYLSTLYTLFQDITITEQYEPESCDVSTEVWKGSPLSIFQNPLVTSS
ncbi:hypothetical protein EXIGLDRAFT_780570 [Exidia glandulosa HHB12029]|uniref:Uncharacterized protein n=1 Tax=Exidia glandulosa HHB12029 TaxID=1314781 RepID=A0A165BJY3_EXIGL|nr:hypothetical protein EXIGLDRAFT_780570 [Exidia glandulosa HHB12029]